MFRFLMIAALVLLLIPPVVFAIAAAMDGFSPGGIAAAVVDQYRAPRQNLFVCGAAIFAPLLVLVFVLWLYRRFGGARERALLMAWGGFIPIVCVQIWVNFSFWPLFLPSRTYPGFPHGLEFVIGPGVFAPAGMLIAVVLVWFTTRGLER